MKTSITTTLAIIGMCAGLLGAAQAQTATAPQPVITAPQLDSNGAVVVMPPYQVRPDVPVPLHTIPLNVGPQYAGQHLEMTFIVDKSGRAYNIDADTTNMPDRYFNVMTASLVTQIAQDIQFWKFEPAHDATGNPIERAVRLPITLGS